MAGIASAQVGAPSLAATSSDEAVDGDNRPMLVVEDLHKSFGPVLALRGMNLSVRRGEVVCVLGPSGSGKSTLLRCINFISPPPSGRVFIDGRSIGHERVGESWKPQKQEALCAIRSEIGMVFQHFNLWSHMSVLGNVIEGL